MTLGDLWGEGLVRNNLANSLITFRRYDDARRELTRAIACKAPFGHAALPWTTWGILHNLERATGDRDAADRARRKAVETYLAYRRAGGENRGTDTHLYAMVAQAVQQGDTTQAERTLAQLSGTDVPAPAKILIPKLRAVLRGDRDPALANDPVLYYQDAVELQLLLEGLG